MKLEYRLGLAVMALALVAVVLALIPHHHQPPIHAGVFPPYPEYLAPANLTVPTIAGTAQQGQTLVATGGTWSGNPVGFSWQWEDCNSGGSSCVNISGATCLGGGTCSYLLVAGDVGDTIRVVETASNQAGSATGTSAQTAVVTSSGGGGGFIPGQCGTGGCTAVTSVGKSVTVNDSTAFSSGLCTGTSGQWCGTPKSVTYNYTIYRPGNLLTSPAPPVVFVWSNNPVSGFPQWKAAAPGVTNTGFGPFVLINMQPDTTQPRSYAAATDQWDTWNTAQGCHGGGCEPVCGVSGTELCDDVPAVQGVLSAINCPYVGGTNPCQGGNTSEYYMLGWSSAGLMTEDIACDSRTGASFGGYGVFSEKMYSPYNTQNPPTQAAAEHPNCPTIAHSVTAHCTVDCVSVSPNTAASWLYVYGTADSTMGGSGTNCSPTNDANDCGGKGFYFTSIPLSWVGGIFNNVENFINPVLGCPSSPTSTTTEGQTSKIQVYLFTGCTNSNVATEIVQVHNGGHPIETWPCGSSNFSALNTASPMPYCTSGTDNGGNHADGMSEVGAALTFWANHPG